MDLRKVEIKTERLLLIPVSPKHRKDMFENLTKEVTKYMFPQPTGNIKDTDDFIERSSKKLRSGTDLTVSIIKKDTGEFIGGGGIHNLLDENNTPSFGIWIKKKAHGHKYGLETIMGIQDWVESNFDYPYLRYSAVVHNIASKKVATSLGGKLTGIRTWKNQLGKQHVVVDYRIYPNKQNR